MMKALPQGKRRGWIAIFVHMYLGPHLYFLNNRIKLRDNNDCKTVLFVNYNQGIKGRKNNLY